jgi:hypothetical protein
MEASINAGVTGTGSVHMAELLLESRQAAISLDTRRRQHWLVGRAAACDLHLPDEGVSRYHATLFHCEGRFYLVDHSLNGTWLRLAEQPPPDLADVPRLEGRLAQDEGAATGTETVRIHAEPPPVHLEPGEQRPERLHGSHAELRKQELSSRLPRLVGFRSHALRTPEDLRELLEMIYSAEGAKTLASMGRALSPGVQAVFEGQERHVVTFIE